MKFIESDGVIIKSWCNEPEESAIAQAKNLAKLPFVFRHVALMPDTHFGFGMPIGGVLATVGAVIPNAVGVDIGCGMLAVQTSLTCLETEALKGVMSKIRQLVPVGFHHHKDPQLPDVVPNIGSFDPSSVIAREADSARYQVGTLGGGNHFIEIQKGSDGRIWYMIHSGSRNFGLKVAKHHNAVAIELNKKWHTSVPKEHELAFLPLESDEGKQYIKEMEACLEFAALNRLMMSARIQDAFYDVTQCDFEREVNIHHNYARWENHFGTNVIVHRKGATSAREGEWGIIPGSQGTCSYIVKGKGNPESFESCSHGAGRRMGRKQAMRDLDLAGEKKRLDDKGIVHSIRHVSDLDEAAGAYKDIDTVMMEQTDLVDVDVRLEPMGVIKG